MSAVGQGAWRIPLLMNVHVIEDRLEDLPDCGEGGVAYELAERVLGNLERGLGLLVRHCAQVRSLAPTHASLKIV